MPNQFLPSCKAETTIQNIILDIFSGIKLLIRKASGAYRVLKSTVGYHLASYLPQYKVYPSLLHLLQEEQIIK